MPERKHRDTKHCSRSKDKKKTRTKEGSAIDTLPTPAPIDPRRLASSRLKGQAITGNKPMSEGEDILSLQRKLRILGHYRGSLTGKLDKETAKAVKDFENKHFQKKQGKEKGPSPLGTIDQTTTDAIDKECEIVQARQRFGIPNLDLSTIFRLEKAGVFRLSDVFHFDIGGGMGVGPQQHIEIIYKTLKSCVK